MEKRVKDHHRKLKKEAKKNRDPNVKRKKPIAVIPGNVPFKDQIIQEAKEMKQKELERKKLLKSILRGDTDIKTVINEKPQFKLNKKKKPIKLKKAASSTTTTKVESMQCD